MFLALLGFPTFSLERDTNVKKLIRGILEDIFRPPRVWTGPLRTPKDPLAPRSAPYYFLAPLGLLRTTWSP